MKIVIDRDLIQTRGDHAGNPSRGIEPNIKIQVPNEAIVTHTPADLFSRYGFAVIEAERPEDRKMAHHQYLDLRAKLLGDEELKKQVDQKFLNEIKKSIANFDEVLLEKVTYQIEPDEDFEKIFNEIKNLKSNALFRALDFDKEKRMIITYSSREGIWEVNGVLTAKSAELRSAGKIRTDRALRSVSDPTKLVDQKRLNYPLFEETRALIESGAIEYSYATREQPDGEWRDDTPTVYVTKLHFKEELTDDDLKVQSAVKNAAENIKKETTHIGKGQATKQAANESLEENKKEIHTKHDPVPIVKPANVNEKIVTEREDALKHYADRLFKQLEERQRSEREELKQKLTAALGEERRKAKQTFISSLTNGMTMTEAIDNLTAAKHNEILIQAVLEEVKTDMILSVKKDDIIAEKSKDLEQTSKELERTKKALESESKANKTNHDNYILELNKRKEAEVAISKLKTVADKLQAALREERIKVSELIEEDKELKSEVQDLTTENEKLFAENLQTKKELDTATERLKKAEIEFVKMKEQSKASESKIQELQEHLQKNDEKMMSRFDDFEKKLEILSGENDKMKNDIDLKIKNRIEKLNKKKSMKQNEQDLLDLE